MSRRVRLLSGLIFLSFLAVPMEGHTAQTWKKVVVSAAGGTPTYLGVTTSSYDGAGVGGFTGANAKCVAQYGAGARLMKIKDITKLNRSTPYPSNGHIDIQDDYQFYTDSNGIVRVSVNLYGGTGTAFLNVTCNSYTSASSGNYYFYLNTVGAIILGACSGALPIHCVRD